ncbi:MAG TPA: 16S rRNA (adenine(1518)-N(6)/adenine(1519)-N(6))-dimethyltransferase RsmA [Gemmatimonadales bacterium]|nr:16S rRNA (adenine(1518)-N(6)/adenine(1519)-N(6))-dimethyltransferase RsmA [Gemmatimonadales bacterium]
MVRARKRLGQHFLHHRRILERIAEALAAPAGARVLEIGPGQGGLTRVLAERGARVTAIEKDPGLAAMVEETLPGVLVVRGDALELEWRSVAGAAPGEPLFVAGNIPYNITSPLLARALQPPRPERIVFLVQEEVADRLAAPAGVSAYGALSVGVQAVAQVEKLFRVPAGAFHPRPRVDSAVVRITPRAQPLVADSRADSFRRMVVGIFGYRRKQLGRGLRELTGFGPEPVSRLLASAGLPGSGRPETVPPEGFAVLHQVLIDAGWEAR